MKKVHASLTVILLLVTLLSGCTSDSDSVTEQETGSKEEVSTGEEKLIIKSIDDMLPLPSELPTEYKIGEKKDITKESSAITSRGAQEGFDSGKDFSISKYKLVGSSVSDVIEITFGIYNFTDSDYSSNFKNNITNSVKNSGGYEEVSISTNAECFSWKEDYGFSGGRLGESVCYNKNVFFAISVSIMNSWKQPDDILKDMTKLVDGKVK